MPSKFDFISPGIQLNEIDESVLPVEVEDVGPLLIGPALKGPGMKPVRVSNLQDFYSVFGKPITGKAKGTSDIWREGNLLNPTYAHFAAQAHLASNTTPITFLRLVGEESSQADATDIKAGWTLDRGIQTAISSADSHATAYGLFLVASGAAALNPTGTLAAILYVSGAALALSGAAPNGGAGVRASTLVESVGAREFKLSISSSAGEEFKTFNFTQGSSKFVRNVLNTNPQKIENNGNFGNTNELYFLGETFEQAVLDNVGGGTAAGDQHGLLLALDNGSNNYNVHQAQARAARTGWFINRGAAQDRLFRLISLSEGEYVNKSISIQISDLKLGNTANPTSVFSVKILEDGNVVETFSGCNLDPSSADYVGKKIGTQYLQWDTSDKKYNVRGLYPNKSNYVYIEIDSAVENQTITDPSALPVGFYGPVKHKSFTVVSGGANPVAKGDGTGAALSGDFLLSAIAQSGTVDSGFIKNLDASRTASFDFPSLRLTTQNTNNNGNYAATDVFGVRHNQGSKTYKDASYQDILRYRPSDSEADNGITIGAHQERSFVFTLEEITSSAEGLYYFSEDLADVSKISLQTLINAGVKKFEAPMIGGFHGTDILKTSPFGQYQLDRGSTRKSSYVRETYEKALDIIQDQEALEYESVAIPGIHDISITNRLITICEDRGDAMAIIDLDGIYEPTWENGGSVKEGSAATIINTAQTRLLDSSFAASYYPSLLLRDTAGAGSDIVVVPPSIGAIGALARSQGLSEPWFAPAGFNRGGINVLGGNEGPRIAGTNEHLSKKNRDDLYLENINPIARFPASGDIVVFGQKTLQQTPSALDRINVRRLLLFLKRRIGKVSETILFDQNVNATWNRFKSRADKILQDVQSRLGITEYKLILDETTTTADLVDRNILYAKVMIKPARAIEFIVVDFVVTRSGIEL